VEEFKAKRSDGVVCLSEHQVIEWSEFVGSSRHSRWRMTQKAKDATLIVVLLGAGMALEGRIGLLSAICYIFAGWVAGRSRRE